MKKKYFVIESVFECDEKSLCDVIWHDNLAWIFQQKMQFDNNMAREFPLAIFTYCNCIVHE